MKTLRLLPWLALCAAVAPLAQAAAPANDGEFHDPFANESGSGKGSGATTACGKASRGDDQFHDPFAAESASATKAVSDPLEPMNRAFYQFNDKLYSWLLKPLARGYAFVAPQPVRDSVGRFFVNLKYPMRGVNNLLEGRLAGAGVETGRFLINTTVGLGGLFDPAAHWGIKPRPADFDQTLAVYGLKTGPYLVLPVLGPSSIRGGFGQLGDAAANPVLYYSWFVGPEWIGYPITGTEMVNTTSLRYKEYDSLKAGTLDPYVALRSAYIDSRSAATEK